MLSRNPGNSRDKRGLTLLQFVIDLIIGIICVVLLFYLASSIAAIFFSPQKPVMQAQGTLENIVEAINYEQEFLLLVPEGWYMVSSSKSQTNEKVILSEECENENCVCLCPLQSRGEWFKLNFRKVDCSTGQCEVLEKPLLENNLLVYRELKPSEFKVTGEENNYKLEEIKKS